MDNGKLSIGSQVELGYLEQTAVSGSDRTVWEEARSRMTALIEAEADIEAASAAASSGESPCKGAQADTSHDLGPCYVIRAEASSAGS